MGVLDHIGITVSDLDRAIAFYSAAFAPLGVSEQMRVPGELTGYGDVVGYGAAGKPEIWLSGGARTEPHVHIALVAPSRAAVDAFYAAAMAAGGTDNGGPGIRPHYHANYYGAFVLDPDGHNIEAVCHRPE
ncbi:VOC family protein [Kaistia sp. MMO-174]|uniref:VOC family protein n=1 Tax=Kaistia sp. MMO-174 TaxID=3081256 RepID=UPI001AC6A807|nr:VOC family protein [Hyphomicrobiales bacterium]